MYRELLLLAVLGGCSTDLPPVCEPGTLHAFDVGRVDIERACYVEDSVLGTCASLTHYLERDRPEYAPSQDSCPPVDVAVTELETGDCLLLRPWCEGMGEGDARYGDCSLSSFAGCCDYGSSEDPHFRACPWEE